MRRAEPIAALGGLLLLVSLFLPWYSTARGQEVSGFDALTVIDMLLVLLALLAILVPIASLASSGPSKPVAVAVLGSAFGWIAILLVAVPDRRRAGRRVRAQHRRLGGTRRVRSSPGSAAG